MKVLLASNSPRRRELLKKLFSSFDVCSPNADEDFIGASPEETAMGIALRKFKATDCKDYEIIICADTVVFCQGRYFNKPKNESDACNMLTFLSGKSHYVYTGVTLKIKDKIENFYDCSEVVFKELTKNEIVDYINNHFVMDKAGAYAIQDGIVVEKYSGSYDNIVGLPTEKLNKYFNG